MGLSGSQHPNYQGKACSKAERLRLKEANSRIKSIELYAVFGHETDPFQLDLMSNFCESVR